MGREIRRVPLGWDHPKDHRGQYLPLYDKDYDTAAGEWLTALGKWESGEDPDRTEYEAESGERRYYWEWSDSPPDRESYRQKWPDGAEMGLCVYETVSEGTPISPVFRTEAEAVEWLIGQGHSRTSAEAFIRSGWAPSFVMTGGHLYSGIDAHDAMSWRRAGSPPREDED
jgi:hypothetical protein